MLTPKKLRMEQENFYFNDIYPVQELQGIIRKWMNVPLGLSDEELEEYFMGGKKLPETIKHP